MRAPVFKRLRAMSRMRSIGLLVIGRDQFIDDADQQRFERWRDRVVVDSRAIVCLTYDQLARDFRDRLTVAKATIRP